MSFESRNLNYIFNIEYFEGINLMNPSEKDIDVIKERNHVIESFHPAQADLLDGWRKLPGFHSFKLLTTYPGLMVGTGYAHDLQGLDGAIKGGFSLDYSTGLPYIPGSSLKGTLRSSFVSALDAASSDKKKSDIERRKFKDLAIEHERFIRILFEETGLSLIEDLNISDLENDLFSGKDIFIGGFISPEYRKEYLGIEYITPHIKDDPEKDRFRAPDPINFLKIRPNTPIQFAFILHDHKVCQQEIPVSILLEVYKRILLYLGIGAKTNVGFGQLSTLETPPVVDDFPDTRNTKEYAKPRRRQDPVQREPVKRDNTQDEMPLCDRCKKNRVFINPSTRSPGRYCKDCLAIVRAENELKKLAEKKKH